MRENFTVYHPVINLIFFAVVIIFSVIILNPLFLAVSFMCAFLYSVYLKGKTAVKFNLLLVIPLLLLSVVINLLVNNRGFTVLFDLPWGQATAESVLYGLTTGLMIGSVIMWFSCFNVIITSDKLIFLFGRVLPGSSLVFVMILRFIPRYRDQIKKISEGQRALGVVVDSGTLKTRIINGTRILSIMFTWALENAIQTADSMKARGYGLKNRTSYMAYKFTFSDKVIMGIMILFTIGLISAYASGAMGTDYFPFFSFAFTNESHSVLIMFMSGTLCFGLFSLLPIALGLREVLYWNNTNSSGELK